MTSFLSLLSPYPPPHRTQASHNKTWHYPHWYHDTWLLHPVNTGCGLTQHYYTPLHRWPSSDHAFTTTSFRLSEQCSLCAINEMIPKQCKPNVKCLQIPRYPGEVRSCLLSRISVASRVSCPGGGASAAHRNLGWRVDNNHHQQPIPPSSVSTS